MVQARKEIGSPEGKEDAYCKTRGFAVQTASDLIAIERPLSHLKADIQVSRGNVE